MAEGLVSVTKMAQFLFVPVFFAAFIRKARSYISKNPLKLLKADVVVVFLNL